jgi:hypothetical protein
MTRMSNRRLSQSTRQTDKWLGDVCCAYCRARWGPWTDILIQPCHRCARPLFLTSRIRPFAPRDQLSGLLKTVDTIQGIAILIAVTLLLFEWIDQRTLGKTVAIALFVSASVLSCDGALGLKTNIIRSQGRLTSGQAARAIAMTKSICGLIAFALSVYGIVIFTS